MRNDARGLTDASGVTVERAPATLSNRARGRRRDRLDERVPHAAVGTLSLPFRRFAAAFGAGVERLRLRHVRVEVDGGGAGRAPAASRNRRVISKLAGFGDRRAELADDDAGRLVGDCHRVGHRRTGREQRAERRDHRVARTRHVEHLARLRRNRQRAGVGEERHALLRARVSSSASRSSSRRSACARRARSSSSRAAPDDLAELAAIGRDQRGAAIPLPLVALRIDEHRLAGCARALDHRRDVREAALAVVGQHERVGPGEQALEVGELAMRATRATAPSRSRCAGVAAGDRSRAASPSSSARRRAGRTSRSRSASSSRSSVSAGSSSPVTESSVARAPSAATLRATFAAPPGRSSVRAIFTTGTGASGEMRSTSPNQ